jgi:S-adenosylmethionine synthetase
MSHRVLFTSESVTEGHPDKVCDQISDAILDAFLAQDPMSRVAAETSVTTGLVLVSGEVTSQTYVDIPGIVRSTIQKIGYEGSAGGGFDAQTCAVITSIDEQSSDIAGGVNDALETRAEVCQEHDELDTTGAGDQGMMFGFACNDTEEYMPMPISLAHKLAMKLAEVRKNNTLYYLRPDGKTQVTVEYVDGKPTRIDTVIISTQHEPVIHGETDNTRVQDIIAGDLRRMVIEPVFETNRVKIDKDTKIYINPSGRFVLGGPLADAGLTGRKIIVDTYGGYSRHGGGAFSGKDPTKVDRSAAYASRYVAKNIVAAGLADKCEIQIAYAIGMSKPVSVLVETFGTAKISEDKIQDLVLKHFDLRPAAIIKKFELRDMPRINKGDFYRKLASYGHMGRTDMDIPWERLDKVNDLKEDAKKLGMAAANV